MILSIFKVSGHSMEPSFKEGDVVVISSLFPIKAADVIIFQSQKKKIIKRVKEIKANSFIVVGDNTADSLDFGPVAKGRVLGKVVFKF